MSEFEPFVGEADVNRLIGALRGERTDRVPHFEILIEDQHVERIIGRKAGNTLGVGGDPAKGAVAGEGVRPMYPRDYIELCRLIGQGAIALEALWTPLKHVKPDGSVGLITNRSIERRTDLNRIIWPGEAEIEERLQYVRRGAKGTGLGVVLMGGCIFQTLYEFVVGVLDCMRMVMDEPDFLEEMMARSADYFAELARRAIEAGLDIFFPADDVACKTGLFVRAELFLRMWRPNYDRILAPAIQEAIKALHEGVCGQRLRR